MPVLLYRGDTCLAQLISLVLAQPNVTQLISLVLALPNVTQLMCLVLALPNITQPMCLVLALPNITLRNLTCLSLRQSELDYIKLDDLADEESVRRLTVRQCRVLLAKHRVTSTAIIEKEQLLDRVVTLWRSYKENKQSKLGVFSRVNRGGSSVE